MSTRPASEPEDDSVAVFLSAMEARDPERPAGALGSAIITIVSSPWWGRRCATCGQTFRSGDPVLVTGEAGVGVKHLVPGLQCAEPDETGGSLTATASSPARDASGGGERGGAAGLRAFTSTLLAAEDPGGPAITVLSADAWQVTRAGDPIATRCPVCAHTFRAGESVIICPCSQQTDRPPVGGCSLTVHRDPSVGLDCWEQWQQAGPLTRCPVALTRLPASRSGA